MFYALFEFILIEVFSLIQSTSFVMFPNIWAEKVDSTSELKRWRLSVKLADVMVTKQEVSFTAEQTSKR